MPQSHFQRLPEGVHEIQVLTWFSELGYIFHKYANLFACQSHFQIFPKDIFNQNSEDVWSAIDGAFGDILGYSQDICEIEGQIIQCPARYWRMSCRLLADVLLTS